MFQRCVGSLMDGKACGAVVLCASSGKGNGAVFAALLARSHRKCVAPTPHVNVAGAFQWFRLSFGVAVQSEVSSSRVSSC